MGLCGLIRCFNVILVGGHRATTAEKISYLALIRKTIARKMPTKFPFIIAIKRIYIASKEYKHDGESFPNEIIPTGKKEAEFAYLLCMIQICRLFVSLLFSNKDVSFAVTTNMNVFSVSVSNHVVVFKGTKAFPIISAG